MSRNLTNTMAVLADEIYKNPKSLNIEGRNWLFLSAISRLPAVGVWVNNGLKIAAIAIRGTANLRDAVEDIYILNNAVERTVNYKEAEKVLNVVRQYLPDYKIFLSGHSYGGSVVTKLAKQNSDITGYSFNRGAAPREIPQMLFDRGLCKIFRFKKKCHDNVKQHTVRNGADPISMLSRLDGAERTRRRHRGLNTHSISNFTRGVDVKPLEADEVKPMDAQPKPLEPEAEPEPEPVKAEEETGGSVMVPQYFNKTRLNDDMINNVFNNAIRNVITPIK